MTEEVTDAMRDAIVGAWLAGARAVHDEWAKADEGQRFYLSRDHAPDFTEAAHDYAASNSPTTNGEGSEPRQTHCADPDCTGPKPHVAEAVGCKWGKPRAASDDKVGRGWEPASAATPGLAYLGAFRNPICKEKWEITGLIQLSDGEFKNYFGSWGLIEKVLLIPSLTNHSDLTEGKK